jgi:hypothetical protein
MLTISSAANRARQFFVPPNTAEPPKPEFSSAREAGQAIRESQSASARRVELDAEDAKSLAAYETARTKRDADVDRIRVAMRELSQASERATRARTFLLAESRPSDKERQLNDDGINLMKARARHCTQYGVTEVSMVAPDDTEDAKLLAQVLSEQKELQATISRSKATPGTSREEHRIRRIATETAELQPMVDRYRLHYSRWQQSVELKQQFEAMFAERDQLRREREEAVIAAAMGTK